MIFMSRYMCQLLKGLKANIESICNTSFIFLDETSTVTYIQFPELIIFFLVSHFYLKTWFLFSLLALMGFFITLRKFLSKLVLKFFLQISELVLIQHQYL